MRSDSSGWEQMKVCVYVQKEYRGNVCVVGGGGSDEHLIRVRVSVSCLNKAAPHHQAVMFWEVYL